SLKFTENNLDAEKRVFCNAFTGCGKKRSVDEESSVDTKSPEKVKGAFFLPSILKKLIRLTLKMKNNLSLLRSVQEVKHLKFINSIALSQTYKTV
ncbi:hypothetical protein TNIN_198461, partial [Trichonephila inaurata madagascariensis]